MPEYNCNIVILSTCAFEQTPILSYYKDIKNNTGSTYVSSYSNVMQIGFDRINVNMKQIDTTVKFLEFIRHNIKNSDFVVLYNNTHTQIPSEILDFLNGSNYLILTENSNVKQSIENKILELYNSHSLKKLIVELNVELNVTPAGRKKRFFCCF